MTDITLQVAKLGSSSHQGRADTCRPGHWMGADLVDIKKMIYPHPALVENIGMAAEVTQGNYTDLPPARE